MNEVVPNIVTVPSTSGTIYTTVPQLAQSALPTSIVTIQQPSPPVYKVNIPPLATQTVMQPQSLQRTFIPNIETIPPVIQHQAIEVQNMPAQSLKQSRAPNQFPTFFPQSPTTMNGMSDKSSASTYNGVPTFNSVQSGSLSSAPSFPQALPPQQPPTMQSQYPMSQSQLPMQLSPLSMQQTAPPTFQSNMPMQPPRQSLQQTVMVSQQQQNQEFLRQLNMECADVNDENFQEIRVEKMEFGMKAY